MEEYVVKVKSFLKRENGVELKCETNKKSKVKIKIDLCKSGLIHFHVAPFSAAQKGQKEKTNLVKKKKWNEIIKFEVDKNHNSVSLRTARLIIKVNKSPCEISIHDSGHKLIWKENVSDSNMRGQCITNPLGFNKKENKIWETMLLNPDEHFYGFGEKFTPLDKRNQRIVSWTVDALGTNTEKSYKNIPFFLSTRGYGIFINSTARIEYRMGTDSSISYSFIIDDCEMDFYFIYGPKFKDVLGDYTDLTGKSPVPPKWSFGLWMSKLAYSSRKELEAICQKLRDYDIPCDVVNLDPTWLAKRCNLEWDERAFPEPEKMIEHLKKKGFKLSLWEHPHVPVNTLMFREGKEKGYFLTHEDGSVYIVEHLCSMLGKGLSPGVIVDFTNPKAVEWYKEKHRHLLKMGVAVFKTDYGEYVPKDAHFYNGLTGKEMHNIYPLLYNRAIFEVTKEINGKGLVWGRSAYAGSQCYPVNWSGDPMCNFPSMACNIKAGLGYGLSGVPFWSCDIGGFKGTPNEQLYIRWAQFGMFCSHSRCHGTFPREPWVFGQRALKIFKFYAKLRYKLIPYIYSYAYIAHQTGLPIMRAMVLEYQDDPNTYDKDLQYLFGENFLVAPIFDELSRRNIYLPKGEWVDYWNHNSYKGPLNLDYKADLNVLPLFVKADSIIPMAPEMNYIGEKPFDPLTLDIYIHSKARFTLYDEEEIIPFQCEKENKNIILKIGAFSRSRIYIVKFNRITLPKKIETTEGKISYRGNWDNFSNEKRGWYFDKLHQILWIKLFVKESEVLRVFL